MAPMRLPAAIAAHWVTRFIPGMKAEASNVLYFDEPSNVPSNPALSIPVSPYAILVHR